MPKLGEFSDIGLMPWRGTNYYEGEDEEVSTVLKRIFLGSSVGSTSRGELTFLRRAANAYPMILMQR